MHPHCLSLLLLTGLSVPCSFHALTGKLRDLRIAEIELRRIYVKKIEMQRKHWKIILREQELLQQVQGRCGGGRLRSREREVLGKERVRVMLAFGPGCSSQAIVSTHKHRHRHRHTRTVHALMAHMAGMRVLFA